MLIYLEINKNKLSGSRTLALSPLSLLGLGPRELPLGP